MTKAELIDTIANSKNMPEGLTKKAVTTVFETAFEEIRKSVKKEGKLTVPGFGTFTKKKRAAREGRNPQTGESIKIKASVTMTFKPAKDLKEYFEK
jgi:DNA-binding protein HU-beta